MIDAIILYNKKSSIDSLKVDFKYDSVTVLYDEKDNLMFVISPQFVTDTDLMAEMTDVIIPSLKNRSMLTGNVNMFILRNEEQLNTFNDNKHLYKKQLKMKLEELTMVKGLTEL